MKHVGKHILFDETDLVTLNRFKQMVKLTDDSIALLKQAERYKKAAFAEVELFCNDQNITWTNLCFDDKENRMEISNNSDDKDPASLFKDLLEGFQGML